jgi:RNA polymerase sigma factor (sigma-70 family)
VWDFGTARPTLCSRRLGAIVIRPGLERVAGQSHVAAQVTSGPPYATTGVQTVSDGVLVDRARLGDRDAFAELILRHRHMALSLCGQMLRDNGLADDAVQEALLQAFLGLERLRQPARFGAWLAGIALNISRRWLRTRASLGNGLSLESLLGGRQVFGPLEPDPAELAEERELTARVRRAVDTLPAGQRAAVALFYLAGLNQAETATALGIPPGAVKARLHKARANLRRALSTLWEETMTITDQAYVEVTLTDVRRIQPNDKYSLARNVLQLREIGGKQRVFGIWVGGYESEAVLILSSDIQTTRPLTYAFAARLLQATGAEVGEVRISKLAAETFFAETVIRTKDGHESLIDSRPSDAIALALQSHAPIRVAEEVMREASQPPHIIPPADGEHVLDRAALLAEMERIRVQRDAETEMINAEIRARRAAEA